MFFENYKNTKIKTEKINCIICNRSEGFLTIGNGFDYEFKTNKLKWWNSYCKKCDHFFLNPRPIIDEAFNIYPKNYYPALNYTEFTEKIILFMRYIFERKRYLKLARYLPNNPCIIDVGVGDGRVLGYLRHILGKEVKLIGIDISVDNKTKEYFKEINVEYIESSIENLDLKKNKLNADLILMNQVLEHLWDPKKVFKKFSFILNVNGVVFIETPNPNCFLRKIQGNKFWGGWHRPRHLNLFSKKSFKLFLKNINFSLEEYSEFAVPAFWIMGIRNYFNVSTHKNRGFIGKFFSLQNIVSLIIFTILENIILIFKLGASNHRFIVKKVFDE